MLRPTGHGSRSPGAAPPGPGAVYSQAMVTRPISRLRRWAPFGLGALFVGTGTLHLARPELFQALIPAGLPAPDLIIVASGVAELICAGGLLSGARWAGPASALLLLAVFPGNVAFALTTSADPRASSLLVAAAWGRLPLQLPLIWAALQARTRAGQ